MYFPKSQIKTNLSTNGGEFMYASNGEEYIGKYYSTSTGKFYTGASPQSGQNAEIIKLTSAPNNDVPFIPDEMGTGRSLDELDYNLIDINDPDQQDCDTLIETPLDSDWLENYPNNVEYASLNPTPKRSIPPHSITNPTPEDRKKDITQDFLLKI